MNLLTTHKGPCCTKMVLVVAGILWATQARKSRAKKRCLSKPRFLAPATWPDCFLIAPHEAHPFRSVAMLPCLACCFIGSSMCFTTPAEDHQQSGHRIMQQQHKTRPPARGCVSGGALTAFKAQKESDMQLKIIIHTPPTSLPGSLKRAVSTAHEQYALASG